MTARATLLVCAGGVLAAAGACAPPPLGHQDDRVLAIESPVTARVGELLRLPVTVETGGDERPYTLAVSRVPEHLRYLLDHHLVLRGAPAPEVVLRPLMNHVGTWSFDVTATIDPGPAPGASGDLTATVEVTIEPPAPPVGPRAPVFREPGHGQVLDLARDPCAVVDVIVDDPDGPVALSAPGRPDGATWLDRGDGTGRLTWCPTRREVADAPLRTLRFSASDGVHPPVTLAHRVLVRAPRKGRCPAPSVATGSLQPQHVSSSTTFLLLHAEGVRTGLDGDPAWRSLATDPSEPGSFVFFPPASVAPSTLALVEIHEDDSLDVGCDRDAVVLIAGPTDGLLPAGCGTCAANTDCESGVCLAQDDRRVCAPADFACEGRAPQLSVDGTLREACPATVATCLGVVAPPAVACDDDQLGPNETVAEATPWDGSAIAVRACPGEVDVLAIEVPAGHRLVAHAREDATASPSFYPTPADRGVASLRVLDAQGAPLASSHGRAVQLGTRSADAAVGARAAETRTVHVEVGVVPGSGRRALELLASVTPDPCTDDGAEPDDMPAAARVLASGQVHAGMLCRHDVDHVAIDVAAPGDLGISLDFDGATIDLDAELLDPAGRVIATLRDDADDAERRTVPVAVAGRYTLRVFGWEPLGCPGGCLVNPGPFRAGTGAYTVTLTAP
ncbi:MAG: hypothetical protein HS111_27580 [Kofleriaceae bacterium]|nr:hypothetical protein [Kofleriaceae bacterium]MCL4225157.1 hypothetical protein [Myxococcales bacterium]